MKRVICLILLFLPSLLAFSQESTRVYPVPDRPVRKFVVADMETRVPIRKVVVATKDGYRDSTNYRGVVHIPTDFDTLMVYKAGYLTAKLTMKEVADTTYLIPSGSSLREVVVWGKDGSQSINEKMADGFARAIQQGAAEAPSGVASFDFANMLDKRGRRDRKHLKKVRAAFKKMDQLDDDPVVNAYLKGQEANRLHQEQQQALDERIALLRKKREEKLRQAAAETQRLTQQDSLATSGDSLPIATDSLHVKSDPLVAKKTNGLREQTTNTRRELQLDMQGAANLQSTTAEKEHAERQQQEAVTKKNKSCLSQPARRKH